MTYRRLILGLAAVPLSACGSSGDDSDTASPGPGSSTPADVVPSPSTAADQTSGQLRIAISADDVELTATLRDTAAARDLVAQLPQTITMSDHGGVEKTGALTQELSLDGEPEGADPDVADLGYYAPGNDLVLYYGDQSYYPGIVILGRLEGDVQPLADLEGDVEVTARAL